MLEIELKEIDCKDTSRTDFGWLRITSPDGFHIGDVEFQSLLPER
jgi:hypothetical protein